MQLVAGFLEVDDLQSRVDWINNPLINEHMFFELPATFEKTKNWFNGIDRSKRLDFVFKDEKNQTLGMSGFNIIDYVNSKAEYYIMINPDFHGMGVGTVITKWSCNHLFAEKNINRVYLYTNDDNSSAYRLYEKCGFVLEGILRKDKCRDGKFLNRRVYALLKSDWLKLGWHRTRVLMKVCNNDYNS